MSNRQDFTDFDETDAGTTHTVAANTITVALLDDDENTFVIEDGLGSGYFSGDFEHTLRFECTLGTGTEVLYLWAISNEDDECPGKTSTDGDGEFLAVYWENAYLKLLQEDSGSSDSDTSIALSLNTTYYLRICRDEVVAGANGFGKAYCYIYTDPHYCELVDKLEIDCVTAKTDYEYLYVATGSNAAGASGGAAWSGTVEYLTLDENPYCLKNLRTRSRDLINEATADFWTDAMLNRFAADGERDLAIKGLCIPNRDSISTTSSTRTVAFTGHEVGYLSYSYTDGALTKELGLKKILPTQTGHLSNNATTPQRWFRTGSNVGIEPRPDDTYTLIAYLADFPTTEITDAYDVPQIQPEFRPLLVLYMVARALEKEGKFAQSAQIHGMYMNELVHTRLDKIEIAIDSRESMVDAQ